MKNLAEDADDTEFMKEIDDISTKVFDIPNINWEKAEKEQVWEVNR